ncbi:serine hydrolase [Pedobacter sp. L105]|uniref:serine hydrolase domain-containing protein n=1 Tax=Pedobacter sp. L105 TaxID=1641871 RepID=UPI00131BEAD5|nr:serine hydrolase domain-containing protein [Pedobacter sp. L105]
MKKSILTSLLFISCVCFTHAQSVNKSRIDSLLTAVAADNQGMGSLAISQNGAIVYQKSTGFSAVNGDHHPLATNKTRYRIGSISKMFTAVMIFQLMDEHKLQLDTKLSVYYPELPNADKITISQMLNHRSGLHNFVRDSIYQSDMVKPHTEAEMIAMFKDDAPDFEPDSKADYSNTNYVLLGYIVEKLTNMTYAQVLKQQIVNKIGLTDTYYGAKINPLKGEAYSYQFKNTWQTVPETDISIVAGAGGIVSTPDDLVKFINALFNGKLISEVDLSLMRTFRNGFGMGMFQLPFGNKKAYGHNGDIDGFSSVVGYFPEQKMAYAYCANGVDYPISNLMTGVLNIYYNIPYDIPVFHTPVLTAGQLDKYIGNYSCLNLPIKIVVTRDGGTLLAQVTGQPSFILKPLGDDKFGFLRTGLVFNFKPANFEFVLEQGGSAYMFTKDQ